VVPEEEKAAGVEVNTTLLTTHSNMYNKGE
jgi:hypothetical protein